MTRLQAGGSDNDIESRVIHLPFSNHTIEFEPPTAWRVEVAEPPMQDPTPIDVAAAIRNPIAGSPLRELAHTSRNAVIVFTDSTRPAPDALLLPPILEELHRGGLRAEDTTLICGVGMHRPSTDEEKFARLGRNIAGGYSVLDHDPEDVVWIGEAMSVPLWVNRRCVEADLLISTGLVEPHQYAGYSGGVKTVAIGCGGSDTIRITHGPRFLDHPSVRLGQVEDNPFQTLIRECAHRVGLRFTVNVVLDRGEQIAHIAAGCPIAVHETLVKNALALYETPVQSAPYDIVVTGVGDPKDVNLYQASRAATYVDDPSLLRDGGVVIVPASCPEGAGDGQGERNASEALSKASSMSGLLERVRSEGCLPGEQRAFKVAKLLMRAQVIIVGAHDPALPCSWHMLGAGSLEEAARMAEALVGPAPNVLVIPHAFQSLPRAIPSR